MSKVTPIKTRKHTEITIRIKQLPSGLSEISFEGVTPGMEPNFGTVLRQIADQLDMQYRS